MVSTAMNEAIKSLWSGLSMQGTHPPYQTMLEALSDRSQKACGIRPQRYARRAMPLVAQRSVERPLKRHPSAWTPWYRPTHRGLGIGPIMEGCDTKKIPSLDCAGMQSS